MGTREAQAVKSSQRDKTKDQAAEPRQSQQRQSSQPREPRQSQQRQSQQSRASSQPRRRSPIVAFINTLIITAAFVAACYLVYPVLQDWWKVHRDNQLMAAESQAIFTRNDQIQQLIDNLNTPEGIESRAREQFGWVYPDEKAVNITGLSAEDSSTAMPESIIAGTVRPDVDWLTATLDFLLGYEYPNAEPSAYEDLFPSN